MSTRHQSPVITLVLASWITFGCLFLGGCSAGGQAPELPEQPSSPDEKVLCALEPYDPIFSLNNSGRVIRLKLEGTRIPPSVVDEIGKLTELKNLSLYAASIDDDSLEKLVSLKHLRSLGLGATRITEKGIAHLESLSELQWMWVSKPLDTSPEVEKLKQAIPGLTVYGQ